VMNAANEVAVEAFLGRRVRFVEIPRVISAALDRHASEPATSLEDLLRADRLARATAGEIVEQGVGS